MNNDGEKEEFEESKSKGEIDLGEYRRMEEATTEFSDITPIPFGHFKGVLLQDLPASYLHHLWTSGMKEKTKWSNDQGKVARYIERSINALKMERKDLIWE